MPGAETVHESARRTRLVRGILDRGLSATSFEVIDSCVRIHHGRESSVSLHAADRSGRRDQSTGVSEDPLFAGHSLYNRQCWCNFWVKDMEKFWSIFCMPIGVLVCFGPVLFAWWQAERKADPHADTGEHD